MSFASEAKNQICKEELNDQQAKAQLCALFQMRASLNMNRGGWYLSYQTENANIAKHVFQIVKRLYQVEPRLSVIKKMRLKKNNIYRIEVLAKATYILEDLMILTDKGLQVRPIRKMVASDTMARSYLQGCFLASGSINDPKTSNYHMEISCQHESLAISVQKLMQRFHLPAKVVVRKNNYIVYLKAGDKIADFLRLCNASQALFEFEDSRIQRDFYNQLTRLDNCELANEMKTLKAAQKQLDYIEVLEANASKVRIPEKIQHVIEIRKQFPDASMNDLCTEVYRTYGDVISKSGMKHRLHKIKELALPFMEKEDNDA